MDSIFKRLQYIGQAPICNLKPSRGLFVNGFCLPLCARCTFVLIGAIVAITLFFVFRKRITYSIGLHFFFVLCVVPCLADGILEYAFKIESDQFRRIVTGFLCGFGIPLFFLLFDKIKIKPNLPIKG